jgi:PUA domain protein
MINQKAKRYFLKDKDVSSLLKRFSNNSKIDPKEFLGSKPQVEVAEFQIATLFLINGKPLLANFEGTLIPTLIFENALSLMPTIEVNMGAIPFICKGADVMSPGVSRIKKEFAAKDYVTVTDDRYNKFISLCVALTDSATARSSKQGKIAKNIHHVGDRLWGLMKNV